MALAAILHRLPVWIGISHLANDILKQVAKFLWGLSFRSGAFGSHIIHLPLLIVLGASSRWRSYCLIDAIVYEDNRFGDGLLVGKDITILWRLGSAVDTHGAELAFH